MSEKARKILSKLTLEEKCSLCAQADGSFGRVPRLDLAGNVPQDNPRGGEDYFRSGRPVEEDGKYHPVAFPSDACLAMSWDEELAYKTGEYFAMDFRAQGQTICEQILFEHCYGYPLGGQFIAIDYCYDIPRILHCHVNPAVMREFRGDYPKEVNDAVIARRTYAYSIDHTDNAQVMDIFTFATYGGIMLGAATYGQMTNFNFDCVCNGIFKDGDSDFNRVWEVAQGSIIANCSPSGNLSEIHPLLMQGKGHLSLTNVDAFSGDNGVVTNLAQSYDFMTVRGSSVGFSIEDKTVVLVDDVIYTARTARAALEAAMKLGRPAKIQLCVLVDRGHTELPIRPNYVGKNIPTSVDEVVAVRLHETDDEDAVKIFVK